MGGREENGVVVPQWTWEFPGIRYPGEEIPPAKILFLIQGVDKILVFLFDDLPLDLQRRC